MTSKLVTSGSILQDILLQISNVIQSEAALSLSDTEHMAYTIGHPCKPYIQPNQPWPYPSYTRATPVYP